MFFWTSCQSWNVFFFDLQKWCFSLSLRPRTSVESYNLVGLDERTAKPHKSIDSCQWDGNRAFQSSSMLLRTHHIRDYDESEKKSKQNRFGENEQHCFHSNSPLWRVRIRNVEVFLTPAIHGRVRSSFVHTTIIVTIRGTFFCSRQPSSSFRGRGAKIAYLFWTSDFWTVLVVYHSALEASILSDVTLYGLLSRMLHFGNVFYASGSTFNVFWRPPAHFGDLELTGTKKRLL